MIYILKDPRNGAVRYVGYTNQTPILRLRGHINKSRKLSDTSHKCCWIRLLLSLNLQPIMEIVDEREGIELENEWILHYRALGCDLTNSCDGGGGLVNVLPEVRKKISQSVKKIDYKHTDEAKQKISESLKKQHETGIRKSLGMTGKTHPPETIERMRISQKANPSYGMLGKHPTEETKEKMRQSNLGQKRSEETCKNVGEAKRKHWADPEWHKKMVEVRQQQVTPETKAAMANRSKELWKDPDFRAKMLVKRRQQGDARREKNALLRLQNLKGGLRQNEL